MEGKDAVKNSPFEADTHITNATVDHANQSIVRESNDVIRKPEVTTLKTIGANYGSPDNQSEENETAKAVCNQETNVEEMCSDRSSIKSNEHVSHQSISSIDHDNACATSPPNGKDGLNTKEHPADVCQTLNKEASIVNGKNDNANNQVEKNDSTFSGEKIHLHEEVNSKNICGDNASELCMDIIAASKQSNPPELKSEDAKASIQETCESGNSHGSQGKYMFGKPAVTEKPMDVSGDETQKVTKLGECAEAKHVQIDDAINGTVEIKQEPIDDGYYKAEQLYREGGLVCSDDDDDYDDGLSLYDDSVVSPNHIEEDLSDDEWDDDDEPKKKPNKKPEKLRTHGEIFPEELPPLEYMTLSPDDSIELEELGVISGVVDTLVVVRANNNSPALYDDTILFIEGRKPLGLIFETFGTVEKPYYSVRFNKPEDIRTWGIEIGQKVLFAPKADNLTKYIFIAELKKIKFDDSSWKNDNAVPNSQREFSDDEEENRHKSKHRNHNRQGEPNTDEVAAQKKRKQYNNNKAKRNNVPPPDRCQPRLLPGELNRNVFGMQSQRFKAPSTDWIPRATNSTRGPRPRHPNQSQSSRFWAQTPLRPIQSQTSTSFGQSPIWSSQSRHAQQSPSPGPSQNFSRPFQTLPPSSPGFPKNMPPPSPINIPPPSPINVPPPAPSPINVPAPSPINVPPPSPANIPAPSPKTMPTSFQFSASPLPGFQFSAMPAPTSQVSVPTASGFQFATPTPQLSIPTASGFQFHTPAPSPQLSIPTVSSFQFGAPAPTPQLSVPTASGFQFSAMPAPTPQVSAPTASFSQMFSPLTQQAPIFPSFGNQQPNASPSNPSTSIFTAFGNQQPNASPSNPSTSIFTAFGNHQPNASPSFTAPFPRPPGVHLFSGGIPSAPPAAPSFHIPQQSTSSQSQPPSTQLSSSMGQASFNPYMPPPSPTLGVSNQSQPQSQSVFNPFMPPPLPNTIKQMFQNK